MNEQTFLEEKMPEWQRLMVLCDRSDRSPTDLTPEELRELVRLYRRISTDLSLVRTISTNASLTQYLNNLAARAYAVLYRAPAQSFGNSIVGAVRQAAVTVRRRRVFVLITTGLFLGSAMTMFLLSANRPDIQAFFESSPQMKATFEQWKSGQFSERSGSEGAMMAAFYASHNPTVSIVTGSVGAATFGLLSLYFIVQNGGILGVLAAELLPVGRVGFLLCSISPHGVPEISGIIMAGAAGLLLGSALIAPGRRTRGDSLKAVGPDAVVLLATSVMLTFIAAPIEGFFSFNPRVPLAVKASVAILSLAAWILFWTQFGRDSDSSSGTLESSTHQQ
jgi:uncharacterized membrane protein SpoIIM required for sporulation